VLAADPGVGTGVRHDADATALALAALATAPLALRRASPLGVVAATSAGILVASILGYAVAAAGLGPILAATSAAYLTDRRGAIVAGVVLAVAVVAATGIALRDEAVQGVQMATTAIVAVLATAIGDVLRTLRERNSELEALRAVEAREAVAQDRVRIARDVHDVVGHALAGITLQARAGRRLVDRDPPRAAEALRLIDELATSALGETRAAVGRIRDPAAAPGLADLDTLVARLGRDDVEVRLRREGDASAVPATVQASAYRIVQEALSNVVKHARPARAVVLVTARDRAVEVDVRDDGRGAPADDGRGNGLRGMRERAEGLGGTLQAGPDPDGGWRVRALLPTDGRPA
jgi:signal transduction histidine kinase